MPDDPALSARRPRALITGASGGIGRAIAIELACRGFDLVLCARRERELGDTARLAGAEARTPVAIRVLPADLSDRAQVGALCRSIAEDGCGLDVVVNNAGTSGARPFDGPEAIPTHNRVLQVNYVAATQIIGELLPLLRASLHPRIVNVASIAGAYACPETAIYSASKFALVGFGEALAGQLRHEGIGVVTVMPGPVPTPGWSHQAIMRRPWLARWMAASPEAVARVVARAATSRRLPRPTRMIPRWYWIGMVLKSLAPPLYRAVTRRVRSGAA